jgi:predicted PP-loop superfamily ATPase
MVVGDFPDIVVRLKDWTGFGATVVIELKYGLTTANEYRRLVGQVADYIKEKMEVVVVLCGPTSSMLASRVKDHMRTLAADKVWFKDHVLTKPVAERTTGGHFLPGNAKDAGRIG